VIDPVTALTTGSGDEAVKLMLIRIIDVFKSKSVTSLFTALTSGSLVAESTSVGISSLMDVWFLLRNIESSGERSRGLYVCKARGMAHSNQIREFVLTNAGIEMVDVLLADDGEILTGSARQLHLKQRELAAQSRELADNRRRSTLENKRKVMEAKVAALKAEYEEEFRLLEADLEFNASKLVSADRVTSEQAAIRSSLG
jgi:circadian clock protein KaiC